MTVFFIFVQGGVCISLGTSLIGLKKFCPMIRCSLTYYESVNCSDSSLHHIFESENFRFPFYYEK